MSTESAELTRLREEYYRRRHRQRNSDLYSFFNPASLFLYQQRQRALLHLIHQQGFFLLQHHTILEVGCGAGGVLLELLSYGATPCRLHGIDLLPDRLAEAHNRLPQLPLICADAQRLPYPAASVDLALQFTAFSSILDDRIKTRMAQEMLRVLKPQGMILWYDFWLNPTNRATRGIGKGEIRRLFPHCTFEFRRITLAPPITRTVIKVSWGFCSLLERMKLLNTHYLVAIRPDH